MKHGPDIPALINQTSRGRKDIGRALVRARLDWIFARHDHGRILVSTLKPKRYRDMGFREICRKASPTPRLMLLEF
jgi:predicted N-acetyltransferase YhbS